MKKRCLCTLPLILFILSVLLFPCTAKNPKFVDTAGLLDARQGAVLSEKLEQIASTQNIDLIIVTVVSLGNQSAQSLADDYFDDNGYGIGSDSSGILFLLAMDERQWAVSTCGEAIEAVSDSDLDKIMQRVIPHLSNEEYDQAFHLFADLIEEGYSKGTSSHENGFLRFIIALVIGAAISGIALFIMRRSMNTSRSQSGAANYMVNNSFELYLCQDFYLYSRTSKVRKAESTSSTHRSSSGRSHGGRSGRF